MTVPLQAGLSIRGLSKTYPAQVALRRVDLDVAAGQVHALLGQNGSGKSTLIKALAGYHQPDPGAAAWLNGRPFELGSAVAAHAAGVRFVHQDLGLVGDLDVIDNLALGGSFEGRRWLSNRREAAAAQRVLDPYGLDIDVRAAVRDCSPAQRTIIAIARALRGGVPGEGLLVLDEPTATLPEREVLLLFSAIRSICARGTAVLYVTHRLGEVFEIAQTVTVLRDGVAVASMPVEQTTPDEVITQIAGRPLDQLYPPTPAPRADVVLDVADLRGPGLAGVSFRLHGGEILGVAGITGSGRDEFNPLLFGSDCAEGRVRIDGREHRPSPAASIAAGLAYLPADRRNLSAIPAHSVRENITLPALGEHSLRWLGNRREAADVLPWLHRLQVQPADPERPFATLSGGNQQKAVLARWLRAGSRIFLLDEPTQGVDVGGKRAIYDALGAVARDGAAVLMTSSDADELAEVCDRVLVLRAGRLVAELTGAALSADAVVAETLREDVVA